MSESTASSDLPAILGGTPIRPDGPPGWPGDWPEVAEAMQAAFSSGDWGRYHGPHCRSLRESLARCHGVEQVQLCSSGTAAIELALRGAKVGPGDEVILAAYDFKSNFQNILAIGATPVLVDLDAESWQLNPDLIADACSKKTKAVIASHLHGGLVDMTSVMAIAAEHGLAVIEDACQATGAIINGRRAGTTGDVGVLSFGGSKLLTAGRGGAVMTSRAEIAQRIRLYVNRGNDAYPLSELQAAVLLPQLERLDERNAARRQFVAELLRSIEHSSGVLQAFSGIADSVREDGVSQAAFYKVGFRYRERENLDRELWCRAMREEGIAFDPGFDALHKTHSRRRFRSTGELSAAAEAHARTVMLHHPVLLEDENSISRIVVAIDRIAANAEAIREKSPASD